MIEVMKRCRIAVLSLSMGFFMPMAQAAESAVDSGAGGPNGGVAVQTDRGACRQITTLLGDDAAYVPGQDVNGNPVVPAEGPGGAPSIGLPDTTTVYLGVDLAKRYGLGGTSNSFGGVVPLGAVTIDQQGQVTINGQPLATGDDPALVAACRKALKPH